DGASARLDLGDEAVAVDHGVREPEKQCIDRHSQPSGRTPETRPPGRGAATGFYLVIRADGSIRYGDPGDAGARGDRARRREECDDGKAPGAQKKNWICCPGVLTRRRIPGTSRP